MKTILFYFILFFSNISFATNNSIVLGIDIDDYPPFVIHNDNKITGFDYDIAQALCSQMNRKCTFKKLAWEQLIPSLISNSIDASISSISSTEERKKIISFSEKYYQSPMKMIRKKGSEINSTIQSMKGRRIGVQRSTTHDNFITSQYCGVLDILRYDNTSKAIKDLKSGLIDVIFGDKLQLKQGFLDTTLGKNFEFFGPDFTSEKYFGDGIAVAVPLGKQNLADEFSKAIKVIRNNGVYKAINDKYFNFDIY